jgi:hypothetical protein
MTNDHGLLISDDGHCLGYLMDFGEHGIYEPSLGKVDVLPDVAETHNRLLDEGLLLGLDNNCEVGQRGTFYLSKRNGSPQVTTWLGIVVSSRVRLRGQVITFWRGNRTYRGRLRKGADCFDFRRVA